MPTSNWRSATAPLLVLLAGCGSPSDRVPVYPAGGTLTYQGRPAAGAIVILHPTDSAAAPVKPRGKVSADGTYRLTTYDTGDGAPAGVYAVSVYWPKPPKAGDPVTDDGPDLLGGRYLRPEQPAARVNVTAGENRFDPITLN